MPPPSTSSLLYGVTSARPVTFAGAAPLLMTIKALAGYLPAPGIEDRSDDLFTN